MFDFWFLKPSKKSDYIMPTTEPLPTIEILKPSGNYSVGITDDGSTMLTLHQSTGMSMTLTLNDVGTKQLIKLLAATLSEDE